MKLLSLLTIAILITSCGSTLSIDTPYGSVKGDSKGGYVITPKPIVYPSK